MINLIPPSAKKKLILEYWLRVCSVWALICSIALLIGTSLMVPVYVLINLQVSNLTVSAESASQKIASLKDVSNELNDANQQAKMTMESRRFVPLSDYTETFGTLENDELKLSRIVLDRAKDGLSPVQMSGEARDRQALAAFRDRLLALPTVASVDLPIANLAKDKDIQFSLTVTMKPKQ